MLTLEVWMVQEPTYSIYLFLLQLQFISLNIVGHCKALATVFLNPLESVTFVIPSITHHYLVNTPSHI